jgi:class 3 adenylate cyclase
MALHTGVAELRGGDYFGTALNRSARIMSAAHGGQILLSAASAELVRGQLPQDTGLVRRFGAAC